MQNIMKYRNEIDKVSFFQNKTKLPANPNIPMAMNKYMNIYSFHMMNISTIQQNYQRAPDYFINPSFKYDAFPPPILYKSFT